MFGVVDCYNHELDSSKPGFGVNELLKSKAHRKKWDDSSNVLTICPGALSGLADGFDSAFCVNKSPFTNNVSVSRFPGFGEEMVRAGLEGLRFERKSEKPVIVLLDGSKTGFLDVSDSFAKSLQRRGVSAVRYYALKNSKNFFGSKPSVLVTGIGSQSRFGCVRSKFSTGSGGVGSVLFQSHNVLGVCLSQDGKVEKLDSGLVNKIRGDFSFVNNSKSDWELLFNSKYESLSERVFWDKKLGLRLGIFDDFLVDKLESRIVNQGFDLLEVSNLVGSVLRGLHAGVVWREDFGEDFDVCFNFSGFMENPVFYSNEHFSASSEILSLLSGSLNLSMSGLLKHFRDRYGSNGFFNKLPEPDLPRLLSGFSSGDWNPVFAGRLCILKDGKFREFVRESETLSKDIKKFNRLSKVFSHV